MSELLDRFVSITCLFYIVFLCFFVIVFPFIRIRSNIRKNPEMLNHHKAKFRGAFWNNNKAISNYWKYIFDYSSEAMTVFFLIAFLNVFLFMVLFYSNKEMTDELAKDFIGLFGFFKTHIIRHYTSLKEIFKEIDLRDWAGFIGSIIAGLMTVFGVMITIKSENKKILNERYNAAKPILYLAKSELRDDFSGKKIRVLINQLPHVKQEQKLISSFTIKNHGGTCIGMNIVLKQKTTMRYSLWKVRGKDIIKYDFLLTDCIAKKKEAVILDKGDISTVNIINCKKIDGVQCEDEEMYVDWIYDMKGYPILASNFRKIRVHGWDRSAVNTKWTIEISYFDIYNNYYKQVHRAFIEPLWKDKTVRYSVEIASNADSVEIMNKEEGKFVRWMFK